MSAETPPVPPQGVIHDIGYRHYDGPRLGRGTIFAALFASSLGGVYGLGRSGRAKILPFLLLALGLAPALILVAVMVLTQATEPLLAYAAYATTIQALVCIFAAAQAPVVFSRDLRHGSIVLYLARPITATGYALARWLGLTAGIFAYLAAPVVVMYLGSVLAELEPSDETPEAVQTLVLLLLLAAMLASISGMISSVSIRRGFAVVGSLGVLLVGYPLVLTVQAIAYDEGAERFAEVASLASPFTLYDGLAARWMPDYFRDFGVPSDAAMTWLYLATSLVIVGGCLALIVWRHRRLAGR